MESDVLTRARNTIAQLSQFLSQPPPSSPIGPSPSTPLSPSSTSTPILSHRALKVKNRQQSLEAITTASAAIVVELRIAVQQTATTEDTERLAQLLSVNDELLTLMKRIPSLDSVSNVGTGIDGGTDSSIGGGAGDIGALVGKRPKLVLQGLGLSFDGNTAGDEPVLSEVKESEQSTDVSPPPDADIDLDPPAVDANGISSTPGEEEAEDATPTTPRIDKGKGRAEPEEEEPEKVLSPSYVIDSDDSDEEEEDPRRLMIPEDIAALMPSPTERYAYSTIVTDIR
jgi:protein phosphatase 1 regulatory subunit 37